MKFTRLLFVLLMVSGLSLTGCGGTDNGNAEGTTTADSTASGTDSTGSDLSAADTPAIDPASLDSAALEEAAEETMAGKGPMTAGEYNLFLGFDMEGYSWKEKYRNQASTVGVYMVTGTYDNGTGTYIDVEMEGCDSKLCRRPTLNKFKKYYANLGPKAKFWEDELKGRKVFFYALEDAWDDKHALTIAGTSYQRESRFTAKAIEVVTGDPGVRKEELKKEIEKLFSRLPG
ncbi:MAG: hypothetical protein AAGN35_21635 [Bacteroidota bacterium]